MNISAKNIANGGTLPVWYYGYSYKELTRSVYVYHIIPLNYLVRWFKYVESWWNKFRSKPNYIDEYVERDIQSKINDLNIAHCNKEMKLCNIIDALIDEVKKERSYKEQLIKQLKQSEG